MSADSQENVSKVNASVLGENVELAPNEPRNDPGSHLAGCGGETE